MTRFLVAWTIELPVDADSAEQAKGKVDGWALPNLLRKLADERCLEVAFSVKRELRQAHPQVVPGDEWLDRVIEIRVDHHAVVPQQRFDL